jgi:hypothetical protein
MFPAKTTELLELQTLRRLLLVFGREVVAIFAIATLQNNIVSHRFEPETTESRSEVASASARF